MGAISAASTVVRAVSALVLVGVLAGCTGDGGIVTTTPSPTVVAGEATPVPSATPSPSDDGALTDEELLALMPEGTADPGAVGAIAAAEFWLDTLGAARASGDTTLLRALATDECEYCDFQASDIDAAYADGWSLSGGVYRVSRGQTEAALRSDGFAYVELHVDGTDIVATSPDGASELADEGGARGFAMQLRRDGLIWLVNGADTRPE